MDIFLSQWKQVLLFMSLWFGHIESQENIALGKQAYQSGTAYDGLPSKAVDGGLSQNFFSGSCTHTALMVSAYWEVDLGDVFFIDHVTVYNRLDGAPERLRDVELYIGADTDHYQLHGFHPGQVADIYTFQLEHPAFGRWVRITRSPTVNSYLSLCEVQIYPYPYTYRYFRMTSNMMGNGQILQTLPARSAIHCSFLCLQDSECAAANYLVNNGLCDLLSSNTSQTTVDENVLLI